MKINFIECVNTVKVFAKKHAPEILTVVSSAATVAAVVSSAKCTRKYDIAKEERKDEIQSKLDKVVVFGESYWPTIVLTATAIAAGVGSTAISKKRQASLLLAYNMLEKRFQKYRNVLADTNPDAYESQEKIYKQSTFEDNGTDLGPGETTYYEPIMEKWFTSTPFEVVQAMSDLNKELIQGGEVSVYTLYVILGIEDLLDDSERRIAAGRGWCSLDEFKTGMKQTEWIDYNLIDETDTFYEREDEQPSWYTVLDIHNWPEILY